jgi:hypothetical protein
MSNRTKARQEAKQIGHKLGPWRNSIMGGFWVAKCTLCFQPVLVAKTIYSQKAIDADWDVPLVCSLGPFSPYHYPSHIRQGAV